ncbi:hypothetical protein [Chryseobacterium culicis]|uniref:hypothetical protein n=1 Tax=Chryseobacterium culicis TaxID=680127 RepID=UPI001873D660|nr:hypothetical protein [Chryseobacterium culicis]MBE4948004.1 hypothetical protein [Chryseobacterium culicis]
MAEIEIKAPFSLSVNVIEIDDYLPSFKLKMIHKKEGKNYNFNNEIKFWIECHKWDVFLEQIKEGKYIELIDMDNIIRFNFQLINGTFIVRINSSINSIEINNVISIYEYKVEEELFKQIINKFKEFPKWW